MDINTVNKAFGKIQDGMRLMSRGPVEFYLDNLTLVYNEFFKRCSPHQIGDTVTLKDRPNTDNGWAHYRDLLVVGTTGKVVEMNFDDCGFNFAVEILDGKHPRVFTLNERFLKSGM